jgi:hypothetical protein
VAVPKSLPDKKIQKGSQWHAQTCPKDELADTSVDTTVISRGIWRISRGERLRVRSVADGTTSYEVNLSNVTYVSSRANGPRVGNVPDCMYMYTATWLAGSDQASQQTSNMKQR